jgi:putative ABC transport system permease protein
MTLTGLSLAYLRDRALTTALNILLIALAVAAMVILVLFTAQLQTRFEREAEGVDLVVGAKGSPMQLILSSVLHADVPTGNIPLATLDQLRADRMVAEAIPLALGDSYRGFRIVGAEPAYPARYGARLASGRMFAAPMEVVLGSDAAESTGAAVGQRFAGTHGLGEAGGGHAHEARPFIVVGVLRRTDTVLDRLILTSVESVWSVHGVAHEPERDAEVTAILVRYRTPMAAIRLPGLINDQPGLQAAVPALEIARLFRLVGVGVDALRALAVLLLLSGGLSIFVALYTALRQREGDMAMLRVIGSSRRAIFGQAVLEGVLLAGAGALLGLLLGHAVTAVAAASSSQLRDMGLDPWRFQPGEAWIVLAALSVGVLAALPPALRVFHVDIADTLAQA